jgi:signal transduction histidine kinase
VARGTPWEEDATRSLRSTILAGLIALDVAVIAGITLVVYAHAHRIEHRALRENLIVRARTLAGVMEVDTEGVEFEITPEMVREFETPGSGAYAEIVDPAGNVVVRSPSLGGGDLPGGSAWAEGEIAFDELDDGPDGIPCATASYAFVARSTGSKAVPPLQRRYFMRVAVDRGPRDRALGELAIFLAAVAGAALLVTIGGGLLVCRMVLRPIRRMTAEAALTTPEDPARRLRPETVVRELADLAGALNCALDGLGGALLRQRRLVADAGHELRTPVSALLASSELLLRRPRTAEEYRSGIERQHRIAGRLSGLTENLLALSRVESGNRALDREVLAPGRIVRALCEELRDLARERNIEFIARVDDDLQVAGDARSLTGLVENLIANALKFTPEGGRVEVSLEAQDGEAVLTVTDNGPGIPPEHLGSLFERFYRVGGGRDRREGAGLGLAIVERVAQAHGGRASVRSELGRGATFEVRLPATRGNDPAPAGARTEGVNHDLDAKDPKMPAGAGDRRDRGRPAAGRA